MSNSMIIKLLMKVQGVAIKEKNNNLFRNRIAIGAHICIDKYLLNILNLIEKNLIIKNINSISKFYLKKLINFILY